jgi:hypothetical protein
MSQITRVSVGIIRWSALWFFGRYSPEYHPRWDINSSAERRLGHVSPALATFYVRLLREGHDQRMPRG